MGGQSVAIVALLLRTIHIEVIRRRTVAFIQLGPIFRDSSCSQEVGHWGGGGQGGEVGREGGGGGGDGEGEGAGGGGGVDHDGGFWLGGGGDHGVGAVDGGGGGAANVA